MNPASSITTASIDLSDYFFTGPTFHWPNIAVSLSEWPMPEWTNEKHGAGMATDTRDIFWFRYKDVELYIGLENRATVDWGQAV